MSKPNSKYSCPNCGSKLFAWVEEVVEHRANINPKTGKMTKTIKKESFGNATGCSGVRCSNCGWAGYTNVEDEPIPGQFLDGVANDGFDRLFESAGGY